MNLGRTSPTKRETGAITGKFLPASCRFRGQALDRDEYGYDRPTMKPRSPISSRNMLYVVEREEWIRDSGLFASLANQFESVTPWATAEERHGEGIGFATKPQLALAELRNLARLLRTRAFYRGRWLFVCMAGHYSCLAFALVLRSLGRRPNVFLFNFYLHELGTSRVVRFILRLLLGRHVRILCQAEGELSYYKSIQPDVAADYAPYCQGPLMEPEWIGSGSYVFAGGYTNRDYDLLIRCAERFPDQEFVIACSNMNQIEIPTPSNVRVTSERDWASFHTLLGHSKIVVVPLRERVGSSGQMVTLAAMEAGKPTIVADSDALSQYIRHEVTGFVYRLGDETSFGDRIRWCLNHPQSLVAVGEAARASYLRQFVRSRFDDAVVAGVLAQCAGE
jgi:glycosyltransferase involved in cell wall biosynthesis